MFINKAGVKFKAFLYLFVGRFKLFGVVIVILSVYCNHKRTNKRKFCFTKILFHYSLIGFLGHGFYLYN